MYKCFKTSIRSLLSNVKFFHTKKSSYLYIENLCRHVSNGKNVNNSKKNRRTQKRHSAPAVSNQAKKNRYRSPFQTPTITKENGTNGVPSDEYDTPKKV